MKLLKLDYNSATRAAMVHDLFLYDWRKKNNRKGLHAFTHGKEAADNASKLFNMNEKELSMIETHMWPVTLKLPRSKEAFILTILDKYSTLKESYDYYKKKLYKYPNLKYVPIMLNLIVLNISNIH